VIGLEFATIFANLGSKVTIIEFLDRVAAGMDEDISETFHVKLTR
jgi:dihydrolipoamide dehydrogenase